MNEVQGVVTLNDDLGKDGLDLVLLTVGLSLLRRHGHQVSLKGDGEGNDLLLKTEGLHLVTDRLQPTE